MFLAGLMKRWGDLTRGGAGGESLGPEGSPQPRPAKLGPSVRQPQGNEFCQHLKGPWKRGLPQSILQMKTQPSDAWIAAW